MADDAAGRYALALIQLAEEHDALEAIGKDLVGIAAMLSRGSELHRALCTPMFSRDERVKVIDALAPQIGAHEITTRFLKLIAGRGGLGRVARVAQAYADMQDERAGRVRVRVDIAEPLTKQLEEELIKAFTVSTGKEVILDARQDESLIGGLVARVGSRVYDASLRRRLEDIKQRLIHAQAPAQA